MAAAAPRSGAGGRAGCSWPQPGVGTPAPVPPARRFDAAWRRAGSGSRRRRQQQTGSSADPAGCVEPTVIQAVLDVPVCLLFLQLCVSKCPDRFVTYTDVQASYRYKCDQWNYFKQFCKPGFNSPLQAPAVKFGEEATEYSLGHFSLLLKPYVMKFVLR
ncbi:uncharacterized protein AAGF69_017018 isoform 1-T5 [Amazona ochrocephala]